MEEATTEKKKGRFVVKNVKADDDDVANVRSTPQVTELATAATEVVPAEDPKAAPPKKSRFTVKTLTAEQDASTQHHEALRQQFHGSTSYSQMELLQRMEQLLEMNMQVSLKVLVRISAQLQCWDRHYLCLSQSTASFMCFLFGSPIHLTDTPPCNAGSQQGQAAPTDRAC